MALFYVSSNFYIFIVYSCHLFSDFDWNLTKNGHI